MLIESSIEVCIDFGIDVDVDVADAANYYS